MRNAGLEEAQGRIKIAKRHINNLRYADDTTLMAEIEEELKSLLMNRNNTYISHTTILPADKFTSFTGATKATR